MFMIELPRPLAAPPRPRKKPINRTQEWSRPLRRRWWPRAFPWPPPMRVSTPTIAGWAVAPGACGTGGTV